MSRYVYGGAPCQLGQYENVATGQILDLTDQEAAAVASDPNFFALPVRTKAEKKVTASADVTTEDSGKIIRLNHTADITITLDEEPVIGDNFEFLFGDAADGTKAVTFDLSGNAYLDGHWVASEVAIETAGTGYTADDVLTVTGGTRETAATITVLSVVAETGAIATAEITNAGDYTVKPANPVSVTGGTGTGGKLNLTWGQPALSIDGSDDSLALYWNGEQWVRY